ncbi:unnamed protein product [Strongylus vulgaris]|uniref:Uncharacterized protein n=1 Tax=Strongylus vulgaris TaxID=40348 RepID=A0A3P7ILE8_STRVU|nr:unnamed protein product [Strongylus vulgaris]
MSLHSSVLQANKPKIPPPPPTNGSSNQMNGNHETTALDFEPFILILPLPKRAQGMKCRKSNCCRLLLVPAEARPSRRVGDVASARPVELWPPVSWNQDRQVFPLLSHCRLSSPQIDSDDYIDVFSWLVMFVAWIYRWFSPAHPGRGDVIAELSSTSPVSEESQALRSRSASLNSFKSSTQADIQDFGCGEISPKSNGVIAAQKSPNGQQYKPRPLQFGIPAICSRFNSILFGPSWNDYTTDDDQSIIIENVRLPHKHSSAGEDQLELDNWACNEKDGFVEHQISVVFAPCFSNELETTVLLPASCSMPGLTGRVRSVDNTLLHTSFTVPLRSESNQEDFSDCYSCMDGESFISSNDLPYSEISAEQNSPLSDECTTTAFLTLPLPRRDVENTTPNGNTIMKKSKTEDNCFQGIATMLF